MFNPEMMKAAQKMMAEMKPEDMQRMSQMAANMDPKMMESMMKNMGAGDGFDASQMAQASEHMKNMTPEQLRADMNQAQNQMQAQKSYMMTGAEKLKHEGNTHVKSEQYSEALAKYSKALTNLKGHHGDDVSTLKLSLLNNSALCHLKRSNSSEALESCKEALSIEPGNFKALFRRGQAQAGLGNLAEAFLDVKQASELQPSDKAICAELKQLRAKLQEEGIDEASLKREKHEVAAAWKEERSVSESSTRASSSSSAPAAGGSDRWSKAAASFAENPEMVAQASAAMSQMDPDELYKMMASQPPPPGMDANLMKSQLETLRKNPEMLKKAMDSFQAMPEETRKQMLSSTNRAGGGGGAPAMPAGADAAALFDNPEMLQQAASMAKDMSEDDLKRLGVNSREEGDAMRKAAEQMASNPDMMKQMSNMMKNMSPEQMQSMMNMSSRMRGGSRSAAAGPEGSPPDADAMANMMNDPDMMKATEDMMKNISPEMLKSMMSPEMIQSMSKANGVELDEGRAQMLARFLPWVLPPLLRLMRWFGYLRKVWSSAWNRKRLSLAGLVVVVAMVQNYRGW